MKSFMNPEEFPFLAQCERDFWWFRGMRLALFRVLDPYLKGRRIGRALEAGCGTGYSAQLLQASRKLPVIPLDIATEGLRYARAAGVKDPVQGNITALPFRGGAFDLLLSLNRAQGTALVMVTHDRRLARRLDRVLELKGGRLQPWVPD